jgi:hypothetical protein
LTLVRPRPCFGSASAREGASSACRRAAARLAERSRWRRRVPPRLRGAVLVLPVCCRRLVASGGTPAVLLLPRLPPPPSWWWSPRPRCCWSVQGAVIGSGSASFPHNI